MADRYFDRNGATAGFGTLTGAWDTTTASWSTSSAGTATPATFTFTNADAARFGETGTSATAGTATIANNVTVTLNGIYVRNLAGIQTVAASGTGNLVFAGTTPFLDLGQTLNVSAPVSGSGGLVVTVSNSTGRVGGAGNRYAWLMGSSSGLTGACSVSGGRFIVAPSTTAARYIPSAINVASDASFEYFPMSNTDFTFPVAPTGTGFIAIHGNHTAGGGVTFSAGQLASFGGLVRAYTAPDAGFQASRLRLNELPVGLDWFAVPNSSGAMTGEITYVGTASTYATNLTLDNFNNTSTAALTGGIYSLIVPNTSGAIVITGTVQRLNTAGTASAVMRLTLGGDNTGDNTLSGNITEVGTNSATLGLIKTGSGRWILSGASSSFTGAITIDGGTLSAQSNAGLGASTAAVTVTSPGVLELSGGVTVNKGSTQLTAHASDPITSVGDNTLQFATFPMTATTTFTVGSGNALRLINSGAISGSGFGITKAGDGELELGTGASTYTGTCTVSAGTLTVKSMNNQSANGVFGNSTNRVALTGALKFAGSSNATTDKVELQGASPTLDASGTSNATATFTSLAQTSTARTLTLTGSGEGIISATLANNGGGAVGVTKAGTGLWRLTGPVTIGDAVAVNAGRLRIQTATSNASMTSTVTIGASGVLELITDELASSSSTAGRVAGTGNMTVSGEVKTRGGTTQKGQVRYGGNLTFQSGSKLYIGGAAA